MPNQLAEPPHNVALAEPLDGVGGLLSELLTAHHESWSVDDLLCHPANAMEYCDLVRRRLGREVADPIILKTLLDTRRSAEGVRLRLPDGKGVTFRIGELRPPDAYFPCKTPECD